MKVRNRVYKGQILTDFCANQKQHLINPQLSIKSRFQHLSKPLKDPDPLSSSYIQTRTILKMRFISQLVVILAGLATVHAAAYIDTRALGKANEYEKENWYVRTVIL